MAILLGNGDGTFGTPALFEAPNGPYAVALGDLNEDGKVDVVVSNVDGTDARSECLARQWGWDSATADYI